MNPTDDLQERMAELLVQMSQSLLVMFVSLTVVLAGIGVKVLQIDDRLKEQAAQQEVRR